MTVTAVHADSASLELHLEVGRDQFRTLAGLITLTQVEVHGAVSDHVRDLLDDSDALRPSARPSQVV